MTFGQQLFGKFASPPTVRSNLLNDRLVTFNLFVVRFFFNHQLEEWEKENDFLNQVRSI